MKPMPEPDVFISQSYRSFLREYYEYKKSKNTKYSFTLFSKQLGFSSRSFIQDLISGKKNISLETLDKFRVLFPRRLDKFEHFRKLVLRDQSKNMKDRSYFDIQIKFERSKNKHDMTTSEYSLYSDWYFVPIFFLACDPNFKDDPRWIREKLAFHVDDIKIKHAIETLYKLEYWKKDKDGKTKVQFESINSHAEADRIVLKQFHSRMLELAREAAEFPFNERILNASTLLVDDQQLNELREKIFKFKETDLKSYQGRNVESGSRKHVYQFQFAVFPLTKVLGVK